MRIVVAEDQQDEARLLARLLQSLGHEVTVTASGPLAVRACLDGRPDVAMVDLLLPGLDGFEVARQIRGNRPGTRPGAAPTGAGPPVLVAITSLRNPAAEEVARTVGFSHFLRKPYTVEDLRELLAPLAELQGQPDPQSGGHSNG